MGLTLRSGRAAIGLLGLLLSAGYIAVGLELPWGSASMPGPGLFPLLLGPLLGLAALALLREAWAMRDAQPLDLPAGEEARRAVLLLVLLTLHLLAMPWIGHFLSAVLISTALIRILRGGGWTVAVGMGIALAAAAQFFFVRLLQVPLPRGEISYWLGI